MPVDHLRVHGIIVKWSWNAGASPLGPMDPGVTEILRKELKAYRNGSPDPAVWTDLDVAAAEHYFLMRSWVGSCKISIEQGIAMTHGYDLAKVITRAFDAEDLLRHNPGRPTTPPDPDVVKWGLHGIAMGEVDRRAFRPDCTPPAFNLEAVTFRSPLMDRINAAREAVAEAVAETAEKGGRAARSLLPGY